jgi:hypothetical protein
MLISWHLEDDTVPNQHYKSKRTRRSRDRNRRVPVVRKTAMINVKREDSAVPNHGGWLCCWIVKVLWGPDELRGIAEQHRRTNSRHLDSTNALRYFQHHTAKSACPKPNKDNPKYKPETIVPQFCFLQVAAYATTWLLPIALVMEQESVYW